MRGFLTEKNPRLMDGDVFVLVSYVRKKGNCSCTLNSCGNSSLVHSTGSCDPLRKDLASLGNVLSKLFYIFIIDGFSLICAELAYFLLSHAAAIRSLFVHVSYLLSLLERDIFLDGGEALRCEIILSCRSALRSCLARGAHGLSESVI